ncbi:hypothetical protein F3Y22_tig00111445pilonHSYRG00118 [Hibiscus syriacus]|uniref:Uncharacterized protein n=1 Tax=Hibiscus syriacus TaxID=106335 RepID=A0A6A2XQT3_HIBSY|nr:hypothetical protein F3Y22_tig00111445pilonHSYRG00118 [Hibiscus syriacus]
MSDYLPVEVIIDILKRLPVESLEKYRGFKNSEANYSSHYDNDGFDEFKQFQFHVFLRVSNFMYAGSCNGLICLWTCYRGVMNFVFWNPSIQKISEEKRWSFSNMILGFGVSAEEFFEISLPESLIGLCYDDLSIMNYGESSIAVHNMIDVTLIECWVMKEYGVVESWAKGEIALHDLNCQLIEPHGVKVGDSLPSVSNYVESLALLDKGVDVSSFSDYAIDSSGYLVLKNSLWTSKCITKSGTDGRE